MTTDWNLRDSASNSQNFVLRLSEDSIVEDTRDLVANGKKRNDDDVIVISDSNSSCSTSPKSLEPVGWQRTASSSKIKNKKTMKYRKLYIFETSSSESEETKLDGDAWRKIVDSNTKLLDRRCVNKINVVQVNRAFYTSDETTTSSSNASCDKSAKDETSKYDVERSCGSPASTFAAHKLMERDTNANREHEISSSVKQTNKETTPSHTVRSVSSSIASELNKFSVRSTPRQNNPGRIRLTKEVAHKIFKNIKSTQVVYDSPREKRQVNVIINESTDTDENMIHPALSSRDGREVTSRGENCDAAETSLRNDIIPDSQTDSSKSRETRISGPTDAARDEDLHRPLSERKKRQIAEWLMTNRPDSPSDSSCSNVPASTRNSMGSGNSSLEKLELNYETPNNRGKIDKGHTDEKQIPLANGTIQSCSTRQATLDRFIQKFSKNDDSEFRTPDRPTFLPSKSHTDKKVSSSAVCTSENVDFKNCADILAKLYGESWKDKANVFLPTTEPKKKIIQTTNRPIQTERKPISKNKYCTIDSDSDKLDSVKRNVKSARKVQRKHKKRDSFIDDESLSSNNSESIYHTALTNFRTSTNSTEPKQWHSKPMPVSATPGRLLTICDTDTEDELDDKSSSDSKKKVRGKKLSFSDDESSDETSEFDPGDYVPPKAISKKGEKNLNICSSLKKSNVNVSSAATKIPQPPKVTPKYESATTITKSVGHRNFLVSLSNAVPMSNAHPDAMKYRLDYKNTKEKLCKELYKLYNEKVFDNKLPRDLSIEWNVRMRGTAGYCYNKKCVRSITGMVKSSRIVLATKILDTPDRVRDTLIHEMCHAAAWLINDVSDGHGPFWTGWATKAMKAFPELPPIRRCHDYEINTKFTYRCTGCGYSIGRHSKSLNIETKRCGHCYGKFELLINKTTKSGTMQVQTPKREPSGFALYVKQNYGSVKKEKSNIKHADVMKILGQQFSALKIAKKNDLALENDPGMTPG